MAAQPKLYHFPSEFVQKSNPFGLTFHNRKKLAMHRLPFVDRAESGGGLSFWAVPKTGGYFGGCETGKNLAKIYLKHLRANGRSHGGLLQGMMLDMFGLDDGQDAAESALRGQVVGLCTELELLLTVAVEQLGGSLDELDNSALLQAANDGLNLDNDAYVASCDEV